MQFQRQILDSIRRILRALRESSRAAENELGLSGAQLLVLQLLSNGQPLSINELAERTQTHQSSVSAIVSKLVENDLVKRGPSSEDGRRVEVELAIAGSKVLKKNTSKMAQHKLFSAIAELSESKQKQLASILSEIVATAGFSEQPASLFFEDDKEKAR